MAPNLSQSFPPELGAHEVEALLNAEDANKIAGEAMSVFLFMTKGFFLRGTKSFGDEQQS